MTKEAQLDLPIFRQAMRRAEANLRLDDVETGDIEEAGNDLPSRENVISHPEAETPCLKLFHKYEDACKGGS